jgi:hypothetical protein
VIEGKFKLEVTMKLLRNSARQLVKTMLVFGFTSAMGVTPLFAQGTTSGTLAGLTNGGTLSIDDKIFSGFSYKPSDLTSFDPSQIIVTATESGGIDYLTWSGHITFGSDDFGTADLLLNYIVTSTGKPIDLIDQSYTGIATNGLLAIDETAATGAFGGTVVGYSHLEIGDTNDPPGETVQGDNLIINPSQSVLYVTKDIGFAVFPGGGSITIDQVEQSFHQVPEPSAMLLGSLGGGLLLLLRLRRQARRD